MVSQKRVEEEEEESGKVVAINSYCRSQKKTSEDTPGEEMTKLLTATDTTDNCYPRSTMEVADLVSQKPVVEEEGESGKVVAIKEELVTPSEENR